MKPARTTYCAKLSLLFVVAFFIQASCLAQVPLTIPSSESLNVDFGHGIINPGPPLSKGYTDFTYSPNGCPASGSYTVVNANNCFGAIPGGAGHFFFGIHPTITDSDYMMIADYEASALSKTVFADTVRNLCSNASYLFWAGILSLNGSSACFYPNFTFSIETVSGTLIRSFQTGDIGAPLGHIDNYSAYFGYQYPDVKATFPQYYGLSFSLPEGITDVVVKIRTNPSTIVRCEASFAIDNILLTRLGPDITISNSSGGWITGSCFQGNLPVVLSGSIGPGYYDFNTFAFTQSVFVNPSVQWQQSLDDGYTWADIPGETHQNLNKVFATPDTFLLRLRGSETENIHNPSCSVVSNIIEVQVDGLPSGFSIRSNSPVCTDSDIVLDVEGGASYRVTGPNGFFDNSAHPHVYHPSLSDSGWYTAQISSFGGCTVADSTFVNVIGPNLSISAMPGAICYGGKVGLAASGGTTYAWSPTETLSNAGISNPVASPLKTTTYTVKVSDETKCSAYGSVTVILRDSVLKAAITGSAILCPDDVAQFRDSSIGSIVSWYWDFGNGGTSTLQNPASFSYAFAADNITYPVRLVVTDTAHCKDTALMYVKAVTNCYIRVPSAFTPNQDGHNDYLYPLNAYQAISLSFIVYNRFGKAVFSTTDWTKKWDGTSNGIPQPAGTYIWILNYTNPDHKRISLKGTTVLLR